jgi:hypothetical protein
MTDPTIHNLRYFLEELEKNLVQMDDFFEKEFVVLKNIHVLQGVMSKMCENWENKLESGKQIKG